MFKKNLQGDSRKHQQDPYVRPRDWSIDAVVYIHRELFKFHISVSSPDLELIPA